MAFSILGKVFTRCCTVWGLLGSHLVPLHPKADLEVQEAFRRDFPDLVRREIGPKVALTKREFWFQDEAQLGQMGILHHIWALKGTQPGKPVAVVSSPVSCF